MRGSRLRPAWGSTRMQQSGLECCYDLVKLLADGRRLAAAHSSDAPHAVTTASSPTDTLPARSTANFAPKAMPPSDARR